MEDYYELLRPLVSGEALWNRDVRFMNFPGELSRKSEKNEKFGHTGWTALHCSHVHWTVSCGAGSFMSSSIVYHIQLFFYVLFLVENESTSSLQNPKLKNTLTKATILWTPYSVMKRFKLNTLKRFVKFASHSILTRALRFWSYWPSFTL